MSRPFIAICGFLGVVLLAGCDTPQTRARAHAAVFHRLAPREQKLVLAGRVRPGMSAEAVYIAWGDPDQKRPRAGGKERGESWLYYRQLTVTAPMGSFDQWSTGNSVFGLKLPLPSNPGFGFGGVGNGGNLLYQPHLQIADFTVKEADFADGKLAHFSLRPGQLASCPAP